MPKVRYVFDTLFMAAGIPVIYSREPPPDGPWILYDSSKTEPSWPQGRCLAIAHCPRSWRLFEHDADDAEAPAVVDGLAVVLPGDDAEFKSALAISCDLIANAFYFLSSWSERSGAPGKQAREMYSMSVFARLHLPQDIVDRYLHRVMERLNALCEQHGVSPWPKLKWPQRTTYAWVLSHDVDFIPSGFVDNAVQGAKTVVRHLFSHRDPGDAVRAALGLMNALVRGRDPYGCVPDIIEREKELDVRASYQVAVGRKHPNDVRYRFEDDRIRDYLRVIIDNGFDLCLHGSYRSTEEPRWYVDEVDLLSRRLGRPLGSRQHYLSFDYDNLFTAQEWAGIQYDMSMGFPDRPGPRAGFSYPYFPYCLAEDRPYDVLEISLFVMDVTLRSYLHLKGSSAWPALKTIIDDVCVKGGCASLVWHPIVFGGARDPGYDRLFWETVRYLRETRGLATDGRTINAFWRDRANDYVSFNGKSGAPTARGV
jgi:hypothetical protein